MAGNGTFLLQPGTYQSAVDKSLRSLVLKGSIVPALATGAKLNQITNVALTSNVATLTANNSLTTGGGDVINVTGFTGTLAFINGQYTTSSATSTTIVIPLTHANLASQVAYGLATVAPTYQTGGLPISLSFIKPNGISTVVAGIGPLATIKWIEVQTISGSALNYKVNLTGTSPLLLVYSGITQATDASAVPFDMAQFRAEFTFGAF